MIIDPSNNALIYRTTLTIPCVFIYKIDVLRYPKDFYISRLLGAKYDAFLYDNALPELLLSHKHEPI